MERTPPLRRAIATTVLVLSAAVAALVPTADAYAERAVGAGGMHVEELGSPSCEPAHSELCQICRVLRLVAPAPGGAAAPAMSVTATCAPEAASRPLIELRDDGIGTPRAPPVRV